MLKVYDRMGTLIHHLTGRVKLLMNIVPCVLNLAEATIRDLHLPFMLRRRNYTTMEKVILTLQLCKLTRGGKVALLISSHAEKLLKDSRSCAVLQVEWVLRILSQCSHAYVVVRTLGVRYGLKVLLPHKVSPEAKWKECDQCRSGVTKAAPTQWSESDLHRLVDCVIQLNANDSGHPWILQINRNHHADLALLHAMSRGHVSTVDRNISMVAELEECIISHSREPWVVLAHGTQPSILSNGDVGVVDHIHLKTQPWKHY
jgi:hypothetical protein